jgi:hypothetical protein
MANDKSPSKFTGTLVALIPLALGGWMLLKPHALDSYEPRGRNYFLKQVVTWVWGYPGGVILVLLGLLLLYAAFLPDPPEDSNEAKPAVTPGTPATPPAVTEKSSIATGEAPDALLREMQELAAKHEELARTNFDVTLDYSEATLAMTDDIIAKHWNEPPVMLDQIVMTFGAYVGETIRRHLGGHWEYDEERGYNLVGMVNSDMRINPFAKVRKRFLNGDEDSIAYCYQVIRKVCEERTGIPPRDTRNA